MLANYLTFNRFITRIAPQFIELATKFENERRDRSQRSERCVTSCLMKGDANPAERFCQLAARYYKYRSVCVDCSRPGAVAAAVKATYREQVSLVFSNAHKLSLNDAVVIERALSGRDKEFSIAVALMFFLVGGTQYDAIPYNLLSIKGRSEVFTFPAVADSDASVFQQSSSTTSSAPALSELTT
ncbi:hypothetical protein [Brucella pseudogrignonensis]|uniref:Helitron helicase-like domain-containing protein n=1 Tax=Brucella pseudogrignonensis TaxID=419475 RepID=A0ABU1MEZ3_9HYPH|nr:hypothetical protein [Brucella pseudogrignonensis]MDR6434614.1 hypothetical protein [Brucella pseudogrignonensis]